MKAWTLDAFDAAPTLRDDLPEPSGETIVAVKATSVNPVDAAIAAGMLRGMTEYTFPVTLGRDFAGVTTAGDEVFGFVPHAGPDVQRGSWAERIAVDAFFAPKPASLSMAEAGAAPLAGVTALLCVEAIDPQPGERVLIVGATGGVGAFAVQLVAQAGATVIAPALEIDREYLTGLGAAEVPDRDARPEADAVIDLVTPGASGARVASPLSNIMALSDPTAVARLGERIDALGLRVPICEGFTFGDVGAALSALGEHKQGKLSVV